MFYERKLIYVLSTLFSLLLVFLWWGDKPYTIDDFVKDHDITDPYIVDLENRSYIFNGNDIYVYRNESNYGHTGYSDLGGFGIGGQEKGSAGVVITNADLVENIKSYRVIVDGVVREYKRTDMNNRYLVISDERIWNPIRIFDLIFLDQEGREIASFTPSDNTSVNKPQKHPG